MEPEIYKNNSIDKLLVENFDNIPLIDKIRIDNKLYGRIDIIINKYYGGRMEILPLIMSFNQISDPIEMKLGMLFELPDLESLETKIIINEILDNDIIPGVNSTPNNKIVNKNLKQTQATATKTTALPKLGITLPHVKYDSLTGNVTF